MAKYDVFISYSRLDTKIADQICRAFDAAGITYFIDRQGLSAGMEFPKVLADAIENSKLFLFLASQNSYKSKFTDSEITYAFNIKEKGNIIPYIIDGSTLPKHLQFVFSSINWTYRRNNEDSTLIFDINKLLSNDNIINLNKDLIQNTDNLIDFKEYSIPINFYGTLIPNNSQKYITMFNGLEINIFDIYSSKLINKIRLETRNNKLYKFANDLIFLENDNKLAILFKYDLRKVFSKKIINSYPAIKIYDVKSGSLINAFTIYEESALYKSLSPSLGLKSKYSFCFCGKTILTYNQEGTLLSSEVGFQDDRRLFSPSRITVLFSNCHQLKNLKTGQNITYHDKLQHFLHTHHKYIPKAMGLYSDQIITVYHTNNSFVIIEGQSGEVKFMSEFKYESNVHYSFSYNGQYLLKTYKNQVNIFDWTRGCKIMTKLFPVPLKSCYHSESFFNANDNIIKTQTGNSIYVWKL